MSAAAKGQGAGAAQGRFLVVRAGRERYGLPLEAVREVVDAAPSGPVPAVLPAVRGVMPLRERFFTLVHLGALVAGGAPPAQPSDTVVIADVGAARVAFEVDDVEAVVEEGATLVSEAAGTAAAAGANGPVVAGVWRVGGGGELVSVLDLSVLGGRLSEATGAGA